jgi:hypothetical protein
MADVAAFQAARVAGAAAASASTGLSVIPSSVSKFFSSILNAGAELCHLAPVLFTFGTAFFAVVTFNYPLAVFAASGAEASVLHTLILMVANANARPEDIKNPPSDACKSSFQINTPATFASVLHPNTTFPSAPLYFLSFGASYIIQSMSFLSDELTALGSQYSNRIYIAILSAFMLIGLYSAYLLAYSCDTFVSVVLSVFIGGFVGYLICSQNLLLLGKPAISTLFIPPLVDRKNMEFLCVQPS